MAWQPTDRNFGVTRLCCQDPHPGRLSVPVRLRLRRRVARRRGRTLDTKFLSYRIVPGWRTGHLPTSRLRVIPRSPH
jgi:hypothetical protein